MSGIELRDVVESDIEVFFEQQLDADAVAMAAFPARDRPAHDAHWAKLMANPALIKKTVLVDGRVAGNIGSYEQDGRWLVGYWIGKDFWGKGVATEALRKLIELLQGRPLSAYVAKHNAGSIRVLEKCGFVVESEVAGPDGVDELLMSREVS